MHIRQYLRNTFIYQEFKGTTKPLRILLITILIYAIGWGIVTPYLPLYFKQILKSYTNVGIVSGLASIFAIFWSFFFGGFIDKTKKKDIMLAMLVLYLPLSYFILSLKTLIHFVWFRLYHSFISTGYWISGNTYVRDFSIKGKETETMSLYEMSKGLAIIVGSMTGGILITHFQFNILWAISLFASIALFLTLFLPTNKKIKLKLDILFKKRSFKKQIKDFLNHKELMRISLVLFLATLSFSFVTLILPLFLDAKGASLIEIGLVTSLFYLPILFEPYFGFKKNKFNLLLAAIFFGTLCFFFMAITENLSFLFILAVLLGICFSAIFPNLNGFASTQMQRNNTGELSAVMFSITSLGAGIGPILSGFIADKLSLKYVFVLGSAIFVILMLLIGTLNYKK